MQKENSVIKNYIYSSEVKIIPEKNHSDNNIKNEEIFVLIQLLLAVL